MGDSKTILEDFEMQKRRCIPCRSDSSAGIYGVHRFHPSPAFVPDLRTRMRYGLLFLLFLGCLILPPSPVRAAAWEHDDSTTDKTPRADAPALVFVVIGEHGFASPEITVKKGDIQFVVVNSSPILKVELEILRNQGESLQALPTSHDVKGTTGRYKMTKQAELPPGKYRVRPKGMEQWHFDLIVEASGRVEK